ncbi:hypothetical protein F5144DRAFT_514844 [Chaetomium tenue]|uniref:Uncharacterized protein n=1 Tax=Chaetomium tenue TaxID=1854479 RepID=A0ACB7P436_9PEZI|nr:hypothetical protein F5144DRAFT_514844 [Chaetomium globosum]
MYSLRRAALRSAVSASRSVSATTRITPFAARVSSECNSSKLAAPQALRFFSQTIRKASEDKDLEDAQRRSEQEAAAEGQQDPEEFVGQSQANVQEASQESAPEAFTPPRTGRVPGTQDQQHSAFIRNLVFELTEEHLVKAFEKYGNVSGAFVARDPRGMSKGFGFVSFDTAEELQAACEAVNGSFWHGRRVTCIPRTEQREGRNKHRNSPSEPTAQLFIGNIPYETTDAELNRIFQGMGNVKDVRVAVDRTTGWPRGFAHADFPSVEAAVDAKHRLEGAKLNDRLLRIDFAQGYRRGQDGAEGRGPRRDRGEWNSRSDRGDRGDRYNRSERNDQGGRDSEGFDGY